VYGKDQEYAELRLADAGYTPPLHSYWTPTARGWFEVAGGRVRRSRYRAGKARIEQSKCRDLLGVN
jgi:hypothetical protein